MNENPGNILDVSVIDLFRFLSADFFFHCFLTRMCNRSNNVFQYM